jgi:hypothetical protein
MYSAGNKVYKFTLGQSQLRQTSEYEVYVSFP